MEPVDKDTNPAVASTPADPAHKGKKTDVSPNSPGDDTSNVTPPAPPVPPPPSDAALTTTTTTNPQSEDGKTPAKSPAAPPKASPKLPPTSDDDPDPHKAGSASLQPAPGENSLGDSSVTTTTTTNDASDDSSDTATPPSKTSRPKSKRAEPGLPSIWNLLVEDYRNKHKAREVPDDEDEDPGSPEAMASDVKKVATGFGHAAGAMSLTASALNLDNGIHAANLGDDYDKNHPDDYMGKRSEAAGYLRVFSSLSAMGSSMASLYGTYGDYRNAKNKGLRDRKKQVKYDTMAGLSGLASSVLSLTSSVMSINGSDPNKTGWVGIASAAAGGLGSTFKTIGAARSASRHGKVADRASKIYDSEPDPKPGISKNEKPTHTRASDMTTIGNIEESRIQGTTKKNAQRAAAKARLYAMSQAETYNREKAQQEKGKAWREGIVGGGSLLAGLGASIFSMAAGKTPLGLIGSGVSGILGQVFKFGGAIANAKAKSKAKKNSSSRIHTVVNDYIDKKKDKIKENARSILAENPNSPKDDELTMEEVREVTENDAIVRKIAIARLRIDVTLDGNNLSEDNYKQAFKAITFRRAENISNSRGEERKAMLDALGIPSRGATVEEIAAALGYEG
ncbi:MAG: hypothetical protein J5649_03130 [Lachnospiraceae bacterium]|nr:hypothetical protein [Lachnospiraceae bacterium]